MKKIFSLLLLCAGLGAAAQDRAADSIDIFLNSKI